MLLKEETTPYVSTAFANILDMQESNIFVVRNKGCELVLANQTALNHLNKFNLVSDQTCKNSFAKLFPEICQFCNKREQAKVDIKDIDGRTFSLTSKRIDWLDGKPATSFTLVDVESERSNTTMLYKSAYLDYLTQIPNRRKLKEDFKALMPQIVAGKKSGVVAIFDLDHFKDINDKYGHNTGDMMLQGLTQHLQAHSSYEGHLYRLGGDEFAFLYADDTGMHTDLHEHYSKLLSDALHSYSLPTIHVSCTISMGASFFPEHGKDIYPLLRKADIALYRAKAAGRNNLVLFEKQHDVVQDFKDVYINIQPILEASGNTFGYELKEESVTTIKDKKVVKLTDFNRTLDIIELNDLFNDKRYFINYTKNMLSAVKQNLLENKFIIQIDDMNHYSEEDLQNCRKLKELGFSIGVNCPNIKALPTEIIDIVEYVKIIPYQNITSSIKELLLNNRNITLIADNINNPQQLAFAKKVGCTLYQGHYFKESKNVTEKIKSVEPLHSNYYKLLKLTSTSKHVEFDEIAKIISSDPALSYRLLKMLNSMELRTKNPISSISMALPYLGEEKLKNWIAIMSLRGIAPDKPLELIRLSLIRARFGELLAPHLKGDNNPNHIFMLGMLSLLHVALDKTQEELLEEISIMGDIQESLLSNTGKYSKLIDFFKNYEYSDWEEVAKFTKEHNLSNKIINDSYITAAKWYNDLTNET